MNALATLKDAEHTVEWQINPTFLLLLLLIAYAVWKTDVLKETGEDRPDPLNDA